MSDYPGAAWLGRYRERVNGDSELKVIGPPATTVFAPGQGPDCAHPQSLE